MARKPWLPTLCEVPDELWARIGLLLDAEDQPKPTGWPRAEQRRVPDEIVCRLRTGCQWNHIPKVYGDNSTMHRVFQQWVAREIFEQIWAMLVEACEELGEVEWRWKAADAASSRAWLALFTPHCTPGMRRL